jgi:hypothetical protein
MLSDEKMYAFDRVPIFGRNQTWKKIDSGDITYLPSMASTKKIHMQLWHAKTRLTKKHWNEWFWFENEIYWYGATSAVRAETGFNSFGEGGTNSQETVGLLVYIVPRMRWSIIVHGFRCSPSLKPNFAPSPIGAGASSDRLGGLQCGGISPAHLPKPLQNKIVIWLLTGHKDFS